MHHRSVLLMAAAMLLFRGRCNQHHPSKGGSAAVAPNIDLEKVVGCTGCAPVRVDRWRDVKEPTLLVLFGDSNDNLAVKGMCTNRTGGFKLHRVESPHGGGAIRGENGVQREVGWRIAMELPWCDLTSTVRLAQIYHYGLSQGPWHDDCIMKRAKHLPIQYDPSPRHGRQLAAHSHSSRAPLQHVVFNLTDSVAVASVVLPELVRQVTASPSAQDEAESPAGAVLGPRRVRIVVQSSIWDAHCAFESKVPSGEWRAYLETKWPERAKLLDAAVKMVDPSALWRTHPIYHNWLRTFKPPADACAMGAWLAREIPAINAHVTRLFSAGRTVPWGGCGVCEGTCLGPAHCCNLHGTWGSYDALFGLIASRVA